MKSAILYHEDLKNYDFGEGHPFRGDRFEYFFNFFEERFSPFKEDLEIVTPWPAEDGILRLVHTQDYIEFLKSASQDREIIFDLYKYVSADNLNPLTARIPRGIEESARIIVGISHLAGELVAKQEFKKAIGIGGGLHHARPCFGEGFCFYNDVAICVENLKKKYRLQRILILDTDAHAGNGTQEIFYKDPQVLFIDLHQDPRTIYPGTGFIYQIGEGEGRGFTVNVPLPPGSSRDAYGYVLDKIVFPLAEEFSPEIIIRYGGSDPHYLDNLTNLGLTLEGFKMIGRTVRAIAEEVCEGKVVDLVTSGYNLEVLPFAWSSLIAGLLNLNIDLSGLREEKAPPQDCGFTQTKEIVGEIRRYLKKYWGCLGN